MPSGATKCIPFSSSYIAISSGPKPTRMFLYLVSNSPYKQHLTTKTFLQDWVSEAMGIVCTSFLEMLANRVFRVFSRNAGSYLPDSLPDMYFGSGWLACTKKESRL